MADDNRSGVPLPGEEEDVDYLFKAQMGVYKLFMSEWKKGLAVVGVILLVSLGIGLYTSWHTDRLKESAQLVDEVDRRMPEPSQAAQMGIAPLDDLNDAEHVANLREGAARYEEAAAAGMGGTSASGWIKAGDTWTRAGDTEKAAAAYENATGAKGVLGFAAHNALAKQAEAAGDIDTAAEHWSQVAKVDQGYLAQLSLMSTVKAWERAGDEDKAKASAQEFLVRFPESPMVGDLSDYATATTTVVPAAGDL